MPKTIATWNIERGKHCHAVSRMLAEHKVDVALLQECDIGMVRSENLHVPKEIAIALDFEYLMAVEFEEHGLGNATERFDIEQYGRSNHHGLHCNAIVASKIPSISHQIKLSHGREWKADGDQPRNGGRCALIAKIYGTYYASVHLEARTSAEKRLWQFKRLLHGLDKIGAERVVIGGDLNTKTPEDQEIFNTANSAFGYAYTDANDDSGRFQGRRLDWFLYRGVTVNNPRTIDATGVSDHDLMLLDVV